MDARIIEMPEDEKNTQKNDTAAKIPTPEEAKGILNSLVEQLGLEDVDLENNPMIEDLSIIFSIMELPDEEFTLMSGAVLTEFERALNNNNDRLLLTQGLSLTGLEASELVEQFQEISAQLEEELKDKYDQKRIDYVKSMMSILVNAISETQGVPKRLISIPIERCHPDAILPQYARVGDAGLDVYALDDYEIKPGETKLIPTGLKVALPLGYELQVRPKSGRALKTKLRVANAPGTIDGGYRDEIGVIIENIESPIKDIEYDFNDDGSIHIKSILHGESYFIGKGEKFAQLVLSEFPTVGWEEVESVSIYGEDRGGGFGSTGLKKDGEN